MSRSAELTAHHELDMPVTDLRALADQWHPIKNVGASIASGSFRNMGMLIAPCSIRTLGEIVSGVTSTLLTRAADVALKERRPLVLMVRETPLHLGHLRNMVAATEMGAIIAPPVPAQNRSMLWSPRVLLECLICSPSISQRFIDGLSRESRNLALSPRVVGI